MLSGLKKKELYVDVDVAIYKKKQYLNIDLVQRVQGAVILSDFDDKEF